MMKRYGRLGFSVYVSSFEKQKTYLEKLRGKDHIIFTSFHIQEEFCKDYKTKVKKMMSWLYEMGFKVVADVSQKTLTQLNYSSLESLRQEIQVAMLRIDYGFSHDALKHMSQNLPIVINASTTPYEVMESITNIFACHNYYPRPETGLSINRFTQINDHIKQLKIPIMAFVAGHNKRGPIYEGLPSLEVHRYQSPYISMLDMLINHKVDTVILGDLDLQDHDLKYIINYLENDEIIIPIVLNKGYESLYDKRLTLRIDSGAFAFRIVESREYASQNTFSVHPDLCKERIRGCLTIDNSLYGRYVGEVQIIHHTLPADERVNVIGQIKEGYLPLLKVVGPGSTIRFLKG